MATSTDRVPYRPSCGSEGADFMAAWCWRCAVAQAFYSGEGDSCQIVADTMVFGVNDPEYPVEWRRDGPRGPRCTAFEAIDPANQPLDPTAVVRPLL